MNTPEGYEKQPIERTGWQKFQIWFLITVLRVAYKLANGAVFYFPLTWLGAHDFIVIACTAAATASAKLEYEEGRFVKTRTKEADEE